MTNLTPDLKKMTDLQKIDEQQKRISAQQRLIDQLAVSLNGARIEVVNDVLTGKPVVALSLGTQGTSVDAHVLAMLVRCLTAFGQLPPGMECYGPSAEAPSLTIEGKTNTGFNTLDRGVNRNVRSTRVIEKSRYFLPSPTLPD